MKLGVLFSGGKDSSYALYKARNEVKVLITLDSKNKDSFMFHTPIDKVQELSKKINLPLIKVKTEGRKEEELEDLKKAIKKAINEYQIEGVVTGAVASTYQASRIQKICDELEIYCFNPLWLKNQEELLREIVELKFKIKIVKVAADGLDESWIGKVIDKKNLEKLIVLSKKYRFSISWEGGEIETEILDGPIFR